MAGFRGVQPSQETLNQILANLVVTRAAMGEAIVAGKNPHQVGPKGEAPLSSLVHINAWMFEIFEPMLAS